MTVEAMEPRLLLSADALGVDSGVLDPDAQDRQPWDIERTNDWWSAGEQSSGTDASDDATETAPNVAIAKRAVVSADFITPSS